MWGGMLRGPWGRNQKTGSHGPVGWWDWDQGLGRVRCHGMRTRGHGAMDPRPWDEHQRPPAPPPSPVPCSRRKPQPRCFLLQQPLGFLRVPEPRLPQRSQALWSSWSPPCPVSRDQALAPLAPGSGATRGPSTACGQVCCGALPWVGGHCRGRGTHSACGPQPGHGALPWLKATAWPWGTTLSVESWPCSEGPRGHPWRHHGHPSHGACLL